MKVAGKKSNFAGFSETNSREKMVDFARIFGSNFAEKRSVKNDRFRGNFLGKFRWRAIGFALI